MVVAVVAFVLLVMGATVALVSRAVSRMSDAASHPTEDARAASEAAIKDVVLRACEPVTAGREAKGTVINKATRRSDFVIQVTFEGPTGQEIDQGTAIIQSLGPSRTTDWSVMSRAERSATAGAVCRVVGVMRTKSP